jgi:Xaa-Pro aminopeptidase
MRCWDVDALLISGLENIRYLTSFTGSSGAVLITGREGYFLTDFRYKVQASEEIGVYKIRCCNRLLDGIAELITKVDVKRVGFEGEKVTFDDYKRFKERLPDKILCSLSTELGRIRAIKSKDEIKSIRKAIDITNRGFSIAAERIKPGISERDLANLIENEVKKHGAEAVSFDVIVASGYRAAFPHGRPSSKRIKKGDFVIVDMGVVYKGYNSDETRTFVVGKPTKRQKMVYQVVKESNNKAIDMVKPGVRASDIDTATRNYIKRKGFGRYFGHGTGHGVGIAVHEPPFISPCSKDILEAGMVFTIEPGIYIPNWGGARIEDMVLVTDRGSEVLTTNNKEMVVI